MLQLALTFATLIGTTVGAVVGVQNIYKQHLEIKKLKKEIKKLEEENQEDSR